MKGNLAPGGAVAKITGKEGLGFIGKARAFNSEDEFVKAVESGSIKKGEKTVVILRYLGPQGGPGQSIPSSFYPMQPVILQHWLYCLFIETLEFSPSFSHRFHVMASNLPLILFWKACLRCSSPRV